MTLPELAVRRPVTTLVILVSIFVIGLIALTRLPLAHMPEMEEHRIFVIVTYPNASPKAVERTIIRPLEEALSSIQGLRHMWSNSDSNGGRVSLNFSWEADMDMVRAEIRDRVDRVRPELPEDIERIQLATDFDPQLSGDTIMEARISSGRDLSSDYPLLERKIIKPIERVPGVASVSLSGVNPREVKVNLRLNAIKRHNLDVRVILNALYENNLDRSLGVVRNTESRFTLRTTGSFRTVEEISDLPIPGTVLYLRDVADITYKEPPLDYGRHLDGNFAVGLSVSQESNANTVQVSQLVRERVAAMEDDPELEGIHFLVWEDQGADIVQTINDLKQTGMIGGILASVILLLFLRRFSSTTIAVMSIPFSLVVACGVIWARGMTMNTITLLGLIVGIGMLVDNAVVIMENIDRFQRKGYGNRVAALMGAREVSVAVIAATLTSVIAFVPVFFSKPSEMNIILGELAFVVCITLLASLFISQTLIPLASGVMGRSKAARDQGFIMEKLKNAYSAALGFTLRHRWITPVVGLAVIGSAYIPYKNVNMNLDTNRSEMFVGINYRFSESIALERKEAIITEVEKALEPYQETFNVDSIYSWWSPRHSLTRLYMEDGFTSEDHMNKVRKALPDLLPKIAGVTLRVQDNTPFYRRNAGNKVAYQLKGPDMETLSELAEQAKNYMAQVPGLFDIYSDGDGGSSELHARVDRDRARAYGVNINQPAEVVELTFRGRRLPRFKDPNGEVEMRLTLEERETESIDQLKSLPLLRGEGTSIPLESFADFAVVKGPESIRRNNRAISVWVGARFDKGNKRELMDQAREQLSKMPLPYGYRWDFQSYGRDQQESMNEFFTNMVLAIGLIYMVMAGLFESKRQAFALLISLPLALSGAYWALYLTDTDMDQPAVIGLLLLLGLVVNNGIVMIEHINGYRRAGTPRYEAMLKGCRERLRPIMITAMTTLFGLIPIVVQKPSLGEIYYYSMAYVIIGGLIVSTVLTSLFLPTVVTLVEDIGAWFGRQFAKLNPRKGHVTTVEASANT